MAVSRLKTWSAGEVLSASDLNAEFNNILNNGQSVSFPRTSSAKFAGYALILGSAETEYFQVSTANLLDLYLSSVALFKFDGTTASVVNGLKFLASATGSAVQVQAQGSDTDISINMVPKGAGTFQINGSAITAPDSDQSIIAHQVFL